VRAWWSDLAARERIALLIAAGVAAAALFWVAVWEPLAAAGARERARLEQQMALLDWLERIAPEVRQQPADASGSARNLGGRSALAVIDQSARAAGLAGALRRIEPLGEREVRVMVERAAFADLMRWLAALVRERPMQVARLDLDRAETGRVDGIIVLRQED